MRTSRWMTAAVLFGGMTVVAVWAQPGGQFFGGGGGPIFLVTNKAVQEDLKMTEDQVAKVTEWAKTEREKVGGIMKEKMQGVDFKTDEGRAKIAAINAEVNKTTYEDLEKANILKPEQFKRLHQIDRQNSGLRAFNNPDV